jgi:hypothetical protein
MGEGVDDREGVEGSRGSEAVGFTKSSFGGYIPTDKGAGTLKAKGGDIGGGSETLAVSTYSVREDAKAGNFSATPIEVAGALSAVWPGEQSHHAQVFIAAAKD